MAGGTLYGRSAEPGKKVGGTLYGRRTEPEKKKESGKISGKGAAIYQKQTGRSGQTEQQRQSPRSTGQQIKNASYGTKTKLNLEVNKRKTREALEKAFRKNGK